MHLFIQHLADFFFKSNIECSLNNFRIKDFAQGPNSDNLEMVRLVLWITSPVLRSLKHVSH